MDSKAYQICTRTVMDTSDPDITFDENGVCQYVKEYEDFKKNEMSPEQKKKYHEETIAKIKQRGKGKKYDCIIGLSGGTDSSYLAYTAKEWGLRPLLVHFDNGFNTEASVNNIEQLVSYLGFDLYTFVMDWEEFKDLQRSYFKASVLDLEIPNDFMIFAALYKIAARENVKYVILGFNTDTEFILPMQWRYSNKFDYTNLKNIHKIFGERPLKHMPVLSAWYQAWYAIKGIKRYDPLNLIAYHKPEAKQLLADKIGWKDYGGKHHESVLTRFYQGYILPRKFNVDKRRAHLSTMICSGMITREEALKELEQPHYDQKLQQEDKEYIAKKLDFTLQEFEDLLVLPNVKHEFYGTDKWQRNLVFGINRIVKKVYDVKKL